MSLKLALLFYGQPRFLKNTTAYDSHKAHIMAQGEVDVYAHYWFEPKETLYERSDFSLAVRGCPADYTPYVLVRYRTEN